MKALIFDPFSGASGDMILGTLISLGADRNEVCEAIESTTDVSVSIEKVSKKGIAAVDVNIIVDRETHSRHYHEIVDVILDAKLPKPVEKDVLQVFEILAKAESKIHDKTLKELHFHEVGQKDAIADIVGSCTAIRNLGAEEIFCTPINVGGGLVETSHGTLPVPAPATLEILKEGGLFFYGNGKREMLTPTGAAILSHYAKPIENMPQGKAVSIGYGAGKANIDNPNVLRIMITEIEEPISTDRVEVLETNVDDVTGEVLGNLFDKLLKLGARDVVIIPATMKKGRPGSIIKVITRPEDSPKIAREIIRETGSLGIRVLSTKHRFVANRKITTIEVDICGQVFECRIKVAEDKNGEIMHISAEYEDCKKLSQATGMPLKEIIRRVEETSWDAHLKK
ncbi:nickel pincer cofactor biosynthesis protein LarC [Methanolobus sp. ZRKC2]|uniref:nickel pincer cofactor biosynthesis protein LarC n=1 Tax=Methanolobus sp. ZRKC2 TaxID=3125783 RepID=UPI003246C058